MARRPLAGALLAALVAAALSVDTRVGTHRYDTDFGTNEGGWQPPDHGCDRCRAERGKWQPPDDGR